MSTETKLPDLLIKNTKQAFWPTAKLEAWKYFDFKKLKNFALVDSPRAEAGPQFEVFISEKISNSIIFKLDSAIISKDLVDLGVRYDLRSDVEVLNLDTKIDHRFLTINAYRPQLMLHFDKINIEETINVIYDFKDIKDRTFSSSLGFNVSNSKVAIYETLVSEQIHGDSLGSVLTQVSLLDSKFCQYVVQEELQTKQGLVYSSEAQLKGKSEYKLFLSSLNSQFVRNQNAVHIQSEKSHAEIFTFVLAAQEAYSESRTEIAHYEENSTSKQLFKSIATDQAKAVFNGRIYIDSKAQKTDSAQSCKGLLLSKKAQINAKPELEIYADDVKAAHGAAIGQVSEDEIFYLLSRGIAPEKAYELLAQAFAGEVIQGIEDLKLQKLIAKKIKKASVPIFKDLVEAYKSQDKKVKKEGS